MHELIAEVLGYLQSATRYKWVSIALAWIISLAGWIFVAQMPDKYQASARVHVDTRSVLRPLLSGLAIQPDVSGQVRLMSKLMFSRPNLEKVARMTDLDLGATDEAAMEKIVNRLQSSVTIAGGENNLFTINAEDQNPTTAKKIVQALLTIFVEQTLGESREDSSSAQKFLDQQIKEYEARLQAAEKALEDFKRVNYGMLPDQGGDLYAQLNGLAKQLDDAKIGLQEAINRRDELQRQLQGEEPTFLGFNGLEDIASPLDTRIQALQARLDELLLKYTKGHPEVIALKKSIADLQKQKEKEIAEAKELGQGMVRNPGVEANPVFQQMRISLSDAEVDVALLSSRVKMFEEKIELLKKQMDERLKVETQLQGLNRDYAAIKENYDALLKRRETARMSESVEQSTDSVKFKIVDPPQVPTKPSAPNRILLSVAVLVASIVVSVGMAIFLALLRPAFNTTNKLREITGRPVLGSVSMNWIPELRERKWREFLAFTAAFATLLVVFIGVIVLEIKGYHLPSFVSRS
ncbi:XrtA system polysaccharide chain length determinant [Methylocaldum szegediense]|uniref:Polysaccharide chain length determinant protein (PEP-CTERM system associated) n=1 Tax=Methylocaldum szegediense TaxID=73780 RepID=A0ABN8XCM7_9GAMM|nr:XrtA system polysaccharide chain length determinant [Methylocaldum szegediense]CAI8965642.1 Polysaccharide chain length determinant protein (PEP-CTERM system associated) [Methylocaldum szegediense]